VHVPKTKHKKGYLKKSSGFFINQKELTEKVFLAQTQFTHWKAWNRTVITSQYKITVSQVHHCSQPVVGTGYTEYR